VQEKLPAMSQTLINHWDELRKRLPAALIVPAHEIIGGKVLGNSSQAVVQLVTYNKKRYALKQYSKSFNNEATDVQRIGREIAILSCVLVAEFPTIIF